ncbi:MAG: hypothetical protein Q8O52_29435 [Sulfuritalea sp.]|nr:hypothetical protein [Sulfuritalea sp.]
MAGEVPTLRPQSSLVVNVPSTEVPKKQTLPDGEINREGIVRARRVQIREGTIVLEGDGKSQEEARIKGPSPVVAPSPNESVAAEAETPRGPARESSSLTAPVKR